MLGATILALLTQDPTQPSAAVLCRREDFENFDDFVACNQAAAEPVPTVKRQRSAAADARAEHAEARSALAAPSMRRDVARQLELEEQAARYEVGGTLMLISGLVSVVAGTVVLGLSYADMFRFIGGGDVPDERRFTSMQIAGGVLIPVGAGLTAGGGIMIGKSKRIIDSIDIAATGVAFRF